MSVFHGAQHAVKCAGTRITSPTRYWWRSAARCVTADELRRRVLDSSTLPSILMPLSQGVAGSMLLLQGSTSLVARSWRWMPEVLCKEEVMVSHSSIPVGCMGGTSFGQQHAASPTVPTCKVVCPLVVDKVRSIYLPPSAASGSRLACRQVHMLNSRVAHQCIGEKGFRSWC